MALLNRSILQKLAKSRLQDTRSLIRIRRYAAAHYLAGYTVELGLKSCIAKQTRRYDFPDEDLGKKVYIHQLDELKKLAGLPDKVDFKADQLLEQNWTIVKDWSEQSRYDVNWLKNTRINRTRAEALLQAIEDPKHGVFQWLQKHW